MIARLSAALTASIVTVAVLAGIVILIAYDMLGEEALTRAWRAATAERPRVAASDLEAARDITFFLSVTPPGRQFEVTTGVRFANAADLVGGRQSSRWCYVMITPRGGLPRQITLARQEGRSAPAYARLNGFPAAEITPLDISALALEEIARTSCRFGGSGGGERLPGSVASNGGPGH